MEVAIINPDTLSTIGLRKLIADIAPNAVIRSFSGFGAFADDTPDMYACYFISYQIYVLYNTFFLPRKAKTVLLMSGVGGMPILSGNHVLNILLPEQRMKMELSKFLSGNKSFPRLKEKEEDKDLSAREIEVLALLSKGLINKEIADKLSISLNTVVSHRKNITGKLSIKSVSGLTLYAVMNGYVEI